MIVYLLHFDQVYLLHFDELYVPYPGAPACACAGHYAGNPAAARKDSGIGWQFARTWWPGTRDLERRLKAQGGASPRCALCGVTPRPGPLPRNAGGRISRTLTTDAQKAAAGLMTAAELAEHTALRYGAVTGRLARPFDRGPVPPGDDPWVLPMPALAGGDMA